MSRIIKSLKQAIAFTRGEKSSARSFKSNVPIFTQDEIDYWKSKNRRYERQCEVIQFPKSKEAQ